MKSRTIFVLDTAKHINRGSAMMAANAALFTFGMEGKLVTAYYGANVTDLYVTIHLDLDENIDLEKVSKPNSIEVYVSETSEGNVSTLSIFRSQL